jgi:hypothetical protein
MTDKNGKWKAGKTPANKAATKAVKKQAKKTAAKAGKKVTAPKKKPAKAAAPAGPPPAFYYKGLPPDPGIDTAKKGVKAPKVYDMTPNNLKPALVLWLFLTTNPEWLAQIIKGGPILDYYEKNPLSISRIAARLGLTTGTVEAIFKLVTTGPNAKEVLAALELVGNTFQEIKAAGGQRVYVPPCPPNGNAILALAPSCWVKNPGQKMPDADMGSPTHSRTKTNW